MTYTLFVLILSHGIAALIGAMATLAKLGWMLDKVPEVPAGRIPEDLWTEGQFGEVTVLYDWQLDDGTD